MGAAYERKSADSGSEPETDVVQTSVGSWNPCEREKESARWSRYWTKSRPSS